MQRRACFASSVCLLLAMQVLPTLAEEVLHEARWADVDLTGGLPADLLQPEGKTRWDLTSLITHGEWTRTLATPDGDGSLIEVTDRVDAEEPSVGRFSDTGSGDGAERWWMPHRFAGTRDAVPAPPLVLREERDGRSETVWIQARRVGLGWLFLPSGPREVYLQRALLMRGPSDARGFAPEQVVHRWIDPRGGVVAEVWGPASPDGTRLEVERAAVVEQVV